MLTCDKRLLTTILELEQRWRMISLLIPRWAMAVVEDRLWEV